jgi:hypothetical protein
MLTLSPYLIFFSKALYPRIELGCLDFLPDEFDSAGLTLTFGEPMSKLLLLCTTPPPILGRE